VVLSHPATLPYSRNSAAPVPIDRRPLPVAPRYRPLCRPPLPPSPASTRTRPRRPPFFPLCPAPPSRFCSKRTPAVGRPPFTVLLSATLELKLLPHFSTAHAFASPAPTTRDPLPLPRQISSEHHRLRRFTVRPSHPSPLSPIVATLTFPLPHRHCRDVTPLPPAT
jgi:hypothetical protein